MEEKIEALKKEYEEILKVIGLDKAQKFTNEEGKIMFLGERWILMNVGAFPGYLIKGNVLGEKLAKEVLYWFGYTYGEVMGETYLKLGTPKEMVLKIAGAIATFFTGWGIPEFLELNLDGGRLVAKFYNDFESESAQINGSEPTNNFFRGVLAGAFSKLIGAKTKATAEFKDGATVIVVEKR
jgi:predicted hydrocarbon binding protein